MATVLIGGKAPRRGVSPLVFAWPCLLALGLGCNSLDAPLTPATGTRLVIPVDTRAPVRATRTPPPLSGGTLLVTRSGLFAVASDPERDKIVVADLALQALRGTIELEAGDEPGRLVEDELGQVHVALRRGGAVVTLDPATLSVRFRRPVCNAPRGIALSSTDTLTVACADGKLVSLPTTDGAVTRTLTLEPDLRDVVVGNGDLRVTRFKTGEVLHLDAAGGLVRRDRLTSVMGSRTVRDVEAESASASPAPFGGSTKSLTEAFRPLVAWRSLAGPNGSTIVLHQRAVDDEIEITPPSSGGSAYGSGATCDGISQNAVSVVGADGAVANVTFMGPPLAVDAALLADGQTLVVAHAGPADPQTPRPFVVSNDANGDETSGGSIGGGFGSTSASLLTLPASPTGGAPKAGTVADDPGCMGGNGLPVDGPAVAVAAVPQQPKAVVVQTMQPSALVIIGDVGNAWNTVTRIPFDDGTTLDTGFQLFHSDSGAGIACASCHPEGAEDGNVWQFASIGERRTQALNVGLEGTAPFHWDGKLPNVGSLMDQVFVGRMGGVHESTPRLSTFEHWLYALEAPAPLRPADDAAAVRGQALFTSAGCATCHAGAHFTDNRTVSVGTDADRAFQVPSLIGVGYRAPFLHDGCAATLLDRFDPACGGGDLHGATSGLDAGQKSDVVAFLETL